MDFDTNGAVRFARSFLIGALIGLMTLAPVYSAQAGIRECIESLKVRTKSNVQLTLDIVKERFGVLYTDDDIRETLSEDPEALAKFNLIAEKTIGEGELLDSDEARADAIYRDLKDRLQLKNIPQITRDTVLQAVRDLGTSLADGDFRKEWLKSVGLSTFGVMAFAILAEMGIIPTDESFSYHWIDLGLTLKTGFLLGTGFVGLDPALMRVSKDAERMWPSATAAIEAAGTNVPEAIMATVITATTVASGLAITGAPTIASLFAALTAGSMVFVGSMPMNVFLRAAAGVYRFIADGVLRGEFFSHLKVVAEYYFKEQFDAAKSNGKEFGLLKTPFLYAKSIFKTVELSLKKSSKAVFHMGLSLLVPLFFYFGLNPAVEIMKETGDLPWGQLLVSLAAIRGSISAMLFAQKKFFETEEFQREAYADELLPENLTDATAYLLDRYDTVLSSGERVEERLEILNYMLDYIRLSETYKITTDPNIVVEMDELQDQFKEALNSQTVREDRAFVSSIFQGVDLRLLERDDGQSLDDILSDTENERLVDEIGHFRVLAKDIFDLEDWKDQNQLNLREKLIYMLPSMMIFSTMAAILGMGTEQMTTLFAGMSVLFVGFLSSKLSSLPEFFNINRYKKSGRDHAANTMVTGSQNVNAMGTDVFLLAGTSVWGRPVLRKLKQWLLGR